MAATTISFSEYTNGGRQRVGRQHVVQGEVTLSGTYTSTKVPITAADFGLGVIESIEPSVVYGEGVTGTGTYLSAYYDDTNSYIELVDEDAAEVASAYDSDSFAFYVTVKGR